VSTSAAVGAARRLQYDAGVADTDEREVAARRRAGTPTPALPRALDDDAAAVGARLERAAQPLWRGATLRAPVVPLDAALASALAVATRAGALVVGLEAASAALDREEHGLAVVAARAGAGRAARISRLLLLADDGAERFYRTAERVTLRHAGRVLACRLEATSTALGRAALGRDAAVKAVLVRHKDAVVQALRAIGGVRERA
jgi:hypothetical protein